MYAYDKTDARKQARAQDLLREALAGGSAVLSVQVLGEFFTVVTRKIRNPMSAEEARGIIGTLSAMSVQDVDLALVQRAIDACEHYGLAYRDALIVAAAERAGCSALLSEDLGAGQAYFGVRAENPFAET